MEKNQEISCPYCGFIFNSMPIDRTGCPNCKEIIYVHDSILGNKKVLFTEEGLFKIVKIKYSQETKDYFISRLRELDAAFRKAQASTQHYGELGRELESLVKNLLSEYLPTKYKLATGFIRSLEKPKWQSNQIDIIFSRNDICHPIAVHNQYSVFPLESIISFMEITSNLTKAKLIEDYEKVADLQRIHKRHYYVPDPPSGIKLYSTEDRAVHPRFYYFAFTTSIDENKISKILKELSNEYKIQLHSMFVLNPGTCYIMPNAEQNTTEPYQKIFIENKPKEAILLFLQHILSSLQSADFIPPNASIPFGEYYK